MSIEAKGNHTPHDQNPLNNEATTDTETTMSTEELRNRTYPDRRPSMFDTVKEHKQFVALVAVGGLALGAGFGASKIAEGLGEQHNAQEPAVTGPAVAGQSETAAPVTEPTPSISPSDLPTSLTSATPVEATPSASSTSPAETAPSTPEEIVKSLEIKSGQTPEKLAKDFLDRTSKWDMAATEKATAEQAIDAGFSGTELTAYAKQIAEEQKPIYAQALFGKDWAKNKDAEHYINGSTKIATQSAAFEIISEDDPETYKTWTTLDSQKIVAGDTTEGTMMINATYHDNVAANDRLVELGAKTEEGNKVVFTARYTTVHGALVFQSIRLEAQD